MHSLPATPLNLGRSRASPRVNTRTQELSQFCFTDWHLPLRLRVLEAGDTPLQIQ